MLATIVTASQNGAQLCALIAAIVFIVAFAAHAVTRTGGGYEGHNYIGSWLVVAGLVFVALSLLWGF
jgi:hypothetical protein